MSASDRDLYEEPGDGPVRLDDRALYDLSVEPEESLGLDGHGTKLFVSIVARLDRTDGVSLRDLAIADALARYLSGGGDPEDPRALELRRELGL